VARAIPLVLGCGRAGELVSVDLVAVPRVPARLDRVSETMSGVLSKLTGFSDPPSPVFVAEVERDRGRIISPGRRLDRASLATITLPNEFEDGVQHPLGLTLGSYEVVLEGLAERSFLVIVGLPELPTMGGAKVHVLLSPTRTCVGVAMTIALAAAVAMESQGEFLDDEVMLLGRPAPSDPRVFIDTTQATWKSSDFIGGCTRFMRQFPSLHGWPPEASLPLEP